MSIFFIFSLLLKTNISSAFTKYRLHLIHTLIMTKADSLTGVKCFSIAGRMVETRQRCLGMTDEERRWRAQWLKDQVLSPEEPRYVPEYYKETNNIFRRLWKTPMNSFEQLLAPVLGATRAYHTRHVIGKCFIGIALLYAGTYFIKYHSNDFVNGRTVEVYKGCKRIFPDDPNYPNYFVANKPSDYYDQGFYSSVLCQDVITEDEDIPPPPPSPRPPPLYLDDQEVCPALAEEN